ncbi:MAG: efflux RND transporter periplasmic adaptor subunit [Terracidiphilus sp.]
MEIKVSGNGQLLSRHIEDLATEVSGRVSRADIKPGAVVRAGDVLVELTNPQLRDSAEEAQSALEGAEAELQADGADLQNAALNQEAVLTKTRLDMERAQIQADLDKAELEQQLIPRITAKQSALLSDQLTNAYAIESRRLQEVRDNIETKLAVRKARVAQLARALDRAKSQVAGLNIVAGIGGIVQAINVEVGQQLQPGSPVGRVAQLEQLYAELKVPAREATQLRMGQAAVIDTRNGMVDGVVERVDPGVTDGTVTVDVALTGALPAGSRPQLQVEGVIYVSRLPNTLYVGKPTYVKNDSTIVVYKLDKDGHYANRTTIRVGMVSVDYLQVLDGLKEGDRIITSEIGEWQGQEHVLLK